MALQTEGGSGVRAERAQAGADAGRRQGRPTRGPFARLSSWLPALVCAGVALVLRVIYLAQSSANPLRSHLGLDMAGYDRWARAILQGHGLGEVPFSQAPLFPLLLSLIYAVCGPDPSRALMVQVLPGIAAVILVARAAGEWRGPFAAWTAGLLLALYKPAIFYTGVLLPPVWSLLAASVVVFLVLRMPAHPEGMSRLRLLCVGLCFGLLALAQPAALVAVIPATWWLYGEGSAKAGAGAREAKGAAGRVAGLARARGGWVVPAWLGAGAALLLLATLLYNGIGGRAWSPIAVNGGINLYIGNGPEANGAYVRPRGMREDRDLLGLEAARTALVTNRVAATRRASAWPASTDAPIPGVSCAAANRYWTRQAMSAIAGHPGKALALYARKLLFFFGQYEVPQIESLPFESRYALLLRLPLPGMALLIALGLLGLLLLWGDPVARYLGASVMAVALGVSAFFVTARFRLVAVPFLTVLAGAGVAELAHALRRGTTSPRLYKRAWLGLAAAVGGGLLLSFNLTGIDTKASEGQYHFRLGTIREKDQQSVGAMEEYIKALACDPTLGKAEVNLGALLARSGRLTEARTHLENGVRLDPQSAIGLVNLGQLDQLEGKTPQALEAYQAAVRVDPALLSARESLAYVLYEAGRLPEARTELGAALILAAPGSAPATRTRSLASLMDERARSGAQDASTNPLLRQADLRLIQGDVPGAARLYREAATKPPVDEARRMLRKIGTDPG
jgi:hypothetical protein